MNFTKSIKNYKTKSKAYSENIETEGNSGIPISGTARR